LATKSEDIGLIVRTISFQDFPPMWSSSTNVTDRQTDRWMEGQMTSDSKTVLCTVVHRMVKTAQNNSSTVTYLKLKVLLLLNYTFYNVHAYTVKQ